MRATYRVFIPLTCLVAAGLVVSADGVIWSESFDACTPGQSVLAAPAQWSVLQGNNDPDGYGTFNIFLDADLHPGWTGLAVDGSSSVGGCGDGESDLGYGYVMKNLRGLLPTTGIVTLSAKMWADRLETVGTIGWMNAAGSWMELAYMSEGLDWYIDVRGYGATVERSPIGVGVDMTVIGKIHTDLDNHRVWAEIVDDATGHTIWTSPEQAIDPAKLPLEWVFLYERRTEGLPFQTGAGMDYDEIAVDGSTSGLIWSENFDSGTQGQSILAAPFQWTVWGASDRNCYGTFDLFLAADQHPGWTSLAIDGSSTTGGCGDGEFTRRTGYVLKDIGALLPSTGLVTLSARMWADQLESFGAIGWMNAAGAWVELAYTSEGQHWYFDVRGFLIHAPIGTGTNMSVIGKIHTDQDNLKVWAEVLDASSETPLWTSGKWSFGGAELPLQTIHLRVVRTLGTSAGLDYDDITISGLIVLRAPSNLTCTVDSTRKVVLNWTNPAAYDRCEVYRDGTTAASLLDGNVTGQTYTDAAAAIGNHTYHVRGVVGAERSASATCSVTVPAVFPPADLSCAAAFGRKVQLSWTNAEAYDFVQVYRDGTAAGNLINGNVTGTSFTDTEVPLGEHSYRVRGSLGGSLSSFAGPCAATVLMDTDFFLHIGDVSGVRDTEHEVLVTLDFDHILSDPPPGPVLGWQYGICSDPALVVPLAITAAGTDTGGLNGGAGPDFIDLDTYAGGVTVGVAVDMGYLETITPRNGWTDVKVNYRLAGAEGDCLAHPLGLTGRLQMCDSLGSPAVTSVAAIEDMSLPAGGFDGGQVQVTCPHDYHIRLVDTEGEKYGLVTVEVLLDFDHNGTMAGKRIQGWSYGLCHDPAQLEAVAPAQQKNAWGSDLAALNGGTGPGFFNLQVYSGGVTVAVILDMSYQTTIPAGNGWHDALISYSAKADSLECTESGQTMTTEITACNTVGTPPVECVMTVNRTSVLAGGQDPATITIRCGTFFRRGDANADGRFDISDPITILGYLFGGEPSTCLDGIDVNDSGSADIADAIYMLGYLFARGTPPPAPFPQAGLDRTADAINCTSYGAR